MNPLQRERWVDEVLREVMAALMHDEVLRQALVFKGAWILNLHLGESRHSMDIDATAEPGWVQEIGSLDNQEVFLREHLPRAVRGHFERQDPVRFTLNDGACGSPDFGQSRMRVPLRGLCRAADLFPRLGTSASAL